MLSIICMSPLRFTRRMYCTMTIILKTGPIDISNQHSQQIGTTCHLSSRLKTQTAMHTFPRHDREPMVRVATRSHPQQLSTASRTQDTAMASETILIRLNRHSRNHKPPKHQIHEQLCRFNQTVMPVLIAIKPRAILSSRQALNPFKRDKAREHKMVSWKKTLVSYALKLQNFLVESSNLIWFF